MYNYLSVRGLTAAKLIMQSIHSFNFKEKIHILKCESGFKIGLALFTSARVK